MLIQVQPIVTYDLIARFAASQSNHERKHRTRNDAGEGNDLRGIDERSCASSCSRARSGATRLRIRGKSLNSECRASDDTAVDRSGHGRWLRSGSCA